MGRDATHATDKSTEATSRQLRGLTIRGKERNAPSDAELVGKLAASSCAASLGLFRGPPTGARKEGGGGGIKILTKQQRKQSKIAVEVM